LPPGLFTPRCESQHRGTKVPISKGSRDFCSCGTFAPGIFVPMDLLLLGTFVPLETFTPLDLLFPGTFASKEGK